MSAESINQGLIRLEYARRGYHLFRNNVGVLRDERDVPVRYGLANETPAENRVLKSSDLIGWRPVLIGPEHIGLQIAQIVSLEVKPPGWRMAGPGDKKRYAHEQAQLAWINMILRDGGEAGFVIDIL